MNKEFEWFRPQASPTIGLSFLFYEIRFDWIIPQAGVITPGYTSELPEGFKKRKIPSIQLQICYSEDIFLKDPQEF